MQTSTLIPHITPNRILVFHPEGYKAVILATNASDMSHEEETNWKQQKVNYSSTEAAGNYYLLEIEHIEGDSNIEEEALATIAAKILIAAADSWNEHIVALNN